MNLLAIVQMQFLNTKMFSKCCICFPLRVGTFLISFLYLCVGVAGITLLMLYRSVVDSWFTTFYNAYWAWYLMISVAAVLGLAGLLGILGTLARASFLVTIFSIVAWIASLLWLGGLLTIIVILVINRDMIMQGCIAFNAYNNQNQKGFNANTGIPPAGSAEYNQLQEGCTTGFRIILIVLGVALGVGFLLMMYFAAATSSYAGNLRRRANYNRQNQWENKYEMGDYRI
ncbi:uncharacterized protein VTP21DRAFT_11575 [Calcarisporiella thermophila]|uniref:uncharacterized protein n=1 Tax=Calcarisporiella thermophila TaxID=911321 RepID=UPI0037448FCE